MRKHTHLHQHIHLQKDAQANAHMHRDERTHPHVQTHKNTHTHLKQRHILGSQPIDEMAESISDWPDRNWRYKSQVLDKVGLDKMHNLTDRDKSHVFDKG